MIELRPLTLADMQTIRVWRDGCRETLRTPYMLTAEMQEQYYRDVICNRDSRTRYWALWGPSVAYVDISTVDERPGSHVLTHISSRNNLLVGYGGLENISWENGNAELSLLIGPDYRGRGYGRKAVLLFLREAFERMRLHSVYGECYKCGPWQFWEKMFGHYPESDIRVMGNTTWLLDRKFWDGKYWPSFYFTFYRGDYEKLMCDTGEGAKHEDTGEEREAVPRETGDRVEPGAGGSAWVREGGGIE